MKQLIKGAAALLLIVNLFSCGNNSKPDNSSSASKTASGQADNNCLLNYAEKYDAALTPDMVLQATGFSAEKMKADYSRVMKNTAYHEINYSFDNQRISKVAALGMDLPTKDVIALSGIKKMQPSLFENSYRALTSEEQAAADNAMNKVNEGKTGDAKVDQSLKDLESKGIEKEERRQVTSTLKNAFQEVAAGYRKVDNLGDAARWNIVTQELVVLQGGVQFQIRVDISNNTEENKSTAISLAKQLLKKCS